LNSPGWSSGLCTPQPISERASKKLKLRFKGRKTRQLVKSTLGGKGGKVALTLRAVATDGAGNRKVTDFKVKPQK
jgi:hypothetical protein